jgi:hypothetical protein
MEEMADEYSSNQTLTGFRRFASRSFSKRRKSSPELKRKGL